jgi:hypothetical protein
MGPFLSIFINIFSKNRIVNVCSQMGLMKEGFYKKELIDQFARPDFTIGDVDKFVEEYKK